MPKLYAHIGLFSLHWYISTKPLGGQEQKAIRYRRSTEKERGVYYLLGFKRDVSKLKNRIVAEFEKKGQTKLGKLLWKVS